MCRALLLTVLLLIIVADPVRAYDTKAECLWDPALARHLTAKQIFTYCERRYYQGGDLRGSPTAPPGGIEPKGSPAPDGHGKRGNADLFAVCDKYQSTPTAYSACMKVLLGK